MENDSGLVKEDDQQMELPPGFRFHPTDEELITHYLSNKVVDSNFFAIAIGEVDLNKIEPWDLPWKAKMGEKEWYFFCVRDKKYPTGLRTNRATAAGYWKATGKDREIFRGNSLVGMKKTLVFYTGRAPKGEKTNWVIHEYRLEGRLSLQNLPKTAKNEWVICRVFQKSCGGKKIHISGLVKLNSDENEMANSNCLPPLTDSSPYTIKIKPSASQSSHVHCFSNFFTAQKSQENMINCFNNSPMNNQIFPVQSSFPSQVSFGVQNPTVLKALVENYTQNFKKEEIVSLSHETKLSTDMNNEISSIVSNLEMGRKLLEDQSLDCLWSY